MVGDEHRARIRRSLRSPLVRRAAEPRRHRRRDRRQLHPRPEADQADRPSRQGWSDARTRRPCGQHRPPRGCPGSRGRHRRWRRGGDRAGDLATALDGDHASSRHWPRRSGRERAAGFADARGGHPGALQRRRAGRPAATPWRRQGLPRQQRRQDRHGRGRGGGHDRARHGQGRPRGHPRQGE